MLWSATMMICPLVCSIIARTTSAIQRQPSESPAPSNKTFQGLFCIDDRICSFRRHVESLDPHCETFGTPGFFGVEFYFQPEHGKAYSKVCPGPVEPKYLIKETGNLDKREAEPHFSKHSHDLLGGWVFSQTLGFWSAIKLFGSIFKPSAGPLGASSFGHMGRLSRLTIENRGNLGLPSAVLVLNLVDTLRGSDALQTSIPGALELAGLEIA